MFRHVSQSGQTLGNISEKHRETSNVSEFARKHFFFSGSKFCFRNNVSTGGQTGKHLRKHRESQMFPQKCFLVCPGLKNQTSVTERKDTCSNHCATNTPSKFLEIYIGWFSAWGNLEVLVSNESQSDVG